MQQTHRVHSQMRGRPRSARDNLQFVRQPTVRSKLRALSRTRGSRAFSKPKQEKVFRRRHPEQASDLQLHECRYRDHRSHDNGPPRSPQQADTLTVRLRARCSPPRALASFLSLLGGSLLEPPNSTKQAGIPAPAHNYADTTVNVDSTFCSGAPRDEDSRWA
jgi:hypothetical protein